MIEDELAELAERVAPAVRPDLTERVLAQLAAADAPARRPERSESTRVRALVAGALATLAAAFLLSPQLRAAAADLLGVAGIEVSRDTPDAPPDPRSPLPDPRPTSIADARAAVDFPIGVPARLRVPEDVVVSDGGRVLTMSWPDGTVLDQFDGSLGPVFGKQVGAVPTEVVRVRGSTAWWIDGRHDLTYVDRAGEEVTATARRAGRSLIWDDGAGVTFRLEGDFLTAAEAAAIARSVR